MTQTQFNAECLARLIAVPTALENDDLVQALRDRNDEEVIRILNEEF